MFYFDHDQNFHTSLNNQCTKSKFLEIYFRSGVEYWRFLGKQSTKSVVGNCAKMIESE